MTEPRLPMVLRAALFVTKRVPFIIRIVSRYLHNRMDAAPERFAERLGEPSQSSKDPVIWFHAASLGEVAQIRALVERLSQSESATILITTTTATGADWVAKSLPEAIHQYVPVDIPSAVDGFLESWNISVAIFVEGDLWPRLILEVRQRNIPQVLLNARNSKTRERFPAAYGALLYGFTKITCRSEKVVEGILSLGVSADVVCALPDLRIAAPERPSADQQNIVAEAIGERPVWFAASTHPSDENAVLAAHERFISEFPDALLVLSPRHPKRGAAIEKSARENGFVVARRSQGEAIGDEIQVYVADTLGELSLFYAVIPNAFIGGSFGAEGGHNPYEPASYGCAIMSGPNVRNFDDAYAALVRAGATELVTEPTEMGEYLVALVRSDRSRILGRAAQTFMDACEEGVTGAASLISEIHRNSDGTT